MPLTDQEIESKSLVELASEIVCQATTRVHNDPVLVYARREPEFVSIPIQFPSLAPIFTELARRDSTRKQLTALRDELISESENKMSMGGEGIARTAEQGFHRGVSIGMTCAAGRINSILKGTP